jgi:hypothetical protein
VTTDRAVAVSDAPATDAIINGFKVTVPGAPAAAPAPAAPPVQTQTAAPVGRPAQPPVATAAGQPAPATLPNPAMSATQPAQNLLALVPGLPPLPNFSAITGR